MLPRDLGLSAIVRQAGVSSACGYLAACARPAARLEVLCAVVEFFSKGGNSAVKELRLQLGFCAPPFVGPVENGSKRQTLLALAPETPNTTLYSGSFGSGVDEERS